MATNESNFFDGTAAVFTVCAKPERTPDYVSGSGSAYWYENGGVIRCADHWGYGIASCNWWLRELDMVKMQTADMGQLLDEFGTFEVAAFCSFADFRDVNEFAAEYDARKREVAFKVNQLF